MYDEGDYMNIEAEVVDPPPLTTPTSMLRLLLNDSSYNPCLNTSGNASDCLVASDPSRLDFSSLERVVAVVVPVLFALIVVVGLIGNTLVVLVVACNPQMRSTTNVLIINLAVADLLFILFCVPFTAFDYALPYWLFGDIWCRVVQYLVLVCAYASIYTLVLMSLDRFLAVVHPIASMAFRNVRNAALACAVLWALIVLACVPALMSHGLISYTYYKVEYSACVFLSNEGFSYATYQICFILSGYLVPLGLIFALYMLMLKRLWFGVAPGGRVSAESLRSKKRVTRMVVIVVVIFAVCWCPIQIILLLKSVGAYNTTSSLRVVIQIVAQILAYMNSCVNPILYAFLSENFRKAFHKVIACHRKEGATVLPSSRHNRETTLNNGVASKSNNTSNDIL